MDLMTALGLPDGDQTVARPAETKKHYKHGCCVDKECTTETCMELPQGKKCGDCIHGRKCAAMFGHSHNDTYCDWFPRRFKERTEETANGTELTGEPRSGESSDRRERR